MATKDRSVEEIVEEWCIRFQNWKDDPEFWKKDQIDWLTQTLQTERQKREEVVGQAEAREKQLKIVHTMELDAVSCMSIEDFVVWRDNRKQRPTQPNNPK